LSTIVTAPGITVSLGDGCGVGVAGRMVAGGPTVLMGSAVAMAVAGIEGVCVGVSVVDREDNSVSLV
jgi:hypothetical protein